MSTSNRNLKMLRTIGTLLLLCLSGVVLRAAQVQGECEHNLQHSQANCSNRNLSKVPWGLHHNIETLDLSNNRFRELTALDFKKYSNLRVLLLRNNSLHRLDPNALANLKHLHTLDLAQNHLTAVPTVMLAKVPSLFTLSLASNKIMLVSDYAFQDLTNLKTLDLRGNGIGELEPNALFNLSKLQKLHLEHNSLSSLPRDMFELLPADLLEVHLHNNRWICDCKIRWMHQWMANGTSAVWQHPGEAILCQGPSISGGKPVSTIPLDELACKVEMRKSGSTQFVSKGEEAVMECQFFSIPTASPIWWKNGERINLESQPDKYTTTTEGSPLTVSKLHVKDFQYEDIAAYECLAENVRGSASTIFKVTLRGVAFDSVVHAPVSASSSAGVDTKSIVVAVAVVCGIILIIVLSVLIFCCVAHIRRREQEKRDAVVENVKKHFLTNGETGPKEQSEEDKSEMDKSKLDQFNDDTNSESTRTNDTNTTQPKQSLEMEYPHDKEPLYTFQQPNSPFNNGNTYVSFGSEMTEPESLQMYPKANSTVRYDGSHTESTTPLLDRYTPSVFDSDDPFNDSLQYPVYEAATLYYPKRNHFPGVNGSVPPLTPGSTRSSTRSTTFIPASTGRYPDYPDYREMRYPYNISPEQHMLASKKSMSVGNLGYQPAPRKPPRTFHSREYVEMNPHDTSGSASDYMTVPQQGYHYGIKPGTPV
ncbi:uncharacterized protein LOC143283678 [Babylonia areolata]|uniref:uncharacterized protein LOC143283678 n=1 Tax=Babylonia areolata TaxID=304850 RepID=UPI003FCFC09F